MFDAVLVVGVSVSVLGVLWLGFLYTKKPTPQVTPPPPTNEITNFLSASLKSEQKKGLVLEQQLQAIKEDLAAQKIYSEKLNAKIETQQETIDDLQQQLKICNDIKDMMVRQMFNKEDTTPLQREKANRIHDMICKHISLDELKTVCFRLDILYNSLEGGERLPAKALSLIQYVIQRNRFNELLEQLHVINPDVEWPL